MSVRQTSSGVEHASIRYERFDNEEEVTIEAIILPIGPATNKLQRETKTMTASPSVSVADSEDIDYTAEQFANTANPEDGVHIAGSGFFSFLNDVKDLLTDIGMDVYDGAKFLYDVCKGQLDKVAVTGQNLVISSPALLANIAEDLPSSNLSNSAKLAWRINVTPAVTLVSLADADFFEALDTGTWCAGCVFLAIVLRDVVASEGASYLCTIWGPALPALVACIVASQALIQFGSQYFGYSDVKDELCAGMSSPKSIHADLSGINHRQVLLFQE